jgi:hypothetical protein
LLAEPVLVGCVDWDDFVWVYLVDDFDEVLLSRARARKIIAHLISRIPQKLSVNKFGSAKEEFPET